jgi:hypothetical protein
MLATEQSEGSQNSIPPQSIIEGITKGRNAHALYDVARTTPVGACAARPRRHTSRTK